MLLKVLRKPNLLNFIIAPIILAILWIPAFIHPHLLENVLGEMPIYEGLKALTNNNPIVLNIIAYFLLIALSFLTVRLNERFFFMRVKTDLSAVLFVLIASGTVMLNGMHPALLALLFIFFSIENTLSIYHGNKTIEKSFNAGFFIGLAAMTYFFSYIYIIWFWITLFLQKEFKIREMLAALVGCIVPLFLIGSIYYLQDNLFLLWENIQVIFTSDITYSFDTKQWSYWAILSFFLLVSIIFTLQINDEQSIRSRKNVTILTVFLLVTILTFLINQYRGVGLYFFTVMPTTMFLSKYFILSRYSWLKEIFFISFIGVTIVVHLI